MSMSQPNSMYPQIAYGAPQQQQQMYDPNTGQYAASAQQQQQQQMYYSQQPQLQAAPGSGTPTQYDQVKSYEMQVQSTNAMAMSPPQSPQGGGYMQQQALSPSPQMQQQIVPPMSAEDAKIKSDENTSLILCAAGVILFFPGLIYTFWILGFISFIVNTVNVCLWRRNHPSTKVRKYRAISVIFMILSIIVYIVLPIVSMILGVIAAIIYAIIYVAVLLPAITKAAGGGTK